MLIAFIPLLQAKPWNGATIYSEALGGSEAAVAYMARSLARLGDEVVVFTTQPGLCDGVRYEHVSFLQAFLQGAQPDVYVISRWLDAVFGMYQMEQQGLAKFGLKMLWIHDLSPGKLEKIPVDGVLCISGYQAANWGFLNQAGAYITSDGVDLSDFEGEEQRDPNRLIWTSNPDRGLNIAARKFQRIRETLPNLELHVYGRAATYGWDPSAEAPYMPEPEYRENVFLHDPLPRAKLARELMKSYIWFYPSFWPETFCCTGDTLVDIPRDYQKHPYGVPIRELVGKGGFYVYSYDMEKDSITLGEVEWVRETRPLAEVWEVELDDGSTLRTTPEHLFLQRDATWKAMRDLQPGDSLMPLYRRVQVDIGLNDGSGKWHKEHRVIAGILAGRELEASEIVHHKDGNPWNNSPDNLGIVSKVEHSTLSKRGRERSKAGEQIFQQKFRATVNSRTLEERQQLSVVYRENAKGFWEGMTKEEREDFIQRRAERVRAKLLGKPEPEEQRTHIGIGVQKYWDNISAEGRIARGQAVSQGRIERKNHKVVAVRRCVAIEPVYNMEVKGHHNFVANGVVIHNCMAGLEAQAAGAVCVAPPYAALPETVKGGVLTYDIEDAVIDLVRDRAKWEELSEKGKAHAGKYDWDEVAKTWQSLFRQLLSNKATASGQAIRPPG